MRGYLQAGQFVKVVAGDFSDPQNERMIFLASGGLFLLGVGMVVATVWWWRLSRTEHPALAPLEVMGEREWAHGSNSERRRLLDTVRPSTGLVPASKVIDEVDLKARERAEPAGFDDLRELAMPPVDASVDASVVGSEALPSAEVIAADVSKKAVREVFDPLLPWPSSD